ncbi:S-layer homology domain-containing protein [Paenibacillus sp. LHD-117]|uniref:S-layer homology domain-containing protein n=1 Tax=Paenibacillus sp. LHD-117 TaxID=3071412 RepID=UPI0027E1E101|nr:S-layer homology domain-containing protein [Paenibacillus sp. LHD-117]MDQ6421197.1 S-layer homology domain-containing protein [Paenibacillus sp. LHD-117]
MKKTIHWIITLALFISVFAGGASSVNAEGGAASELPFSDISKHWAKDMILQAYDKGFVEGFEDGTFRPDDVVQADQFIAMILRSYSVTKNEKTEFDPSWLAALEKDRPGFAYFIKNAVSTTKFNFKNASSGYWATPYVNFLFDSYVISNTDLVFPKNHSLFQKQIKRDAASYLLGAWFAKVEGKYDTMYQDYVLSKSGIKDINNFSPYTDWYRATVLISGLMNGYPDGKFYPQRYVTRAEALTMVLRLKDTALRKPFQPSLNGLNYTTNNGKIYLYNDKYALDMYNKMVDLAKKHVTKGHVNLFGGDAIEVFSSKDSFDKFVYFTEIGQFHLRPEDELSAFVNRDGTKKLGFSYPVTSIFKTSNDYLNALYELLAGNGKGKELRKKVEAYIVETAQKDFSFNGKNFTYREVGKRFEVTLKY